MTDEEKKNKRALVFGGGGARGAFEIGVWKALDELEYKTDMVFGTSVGALNGALYLQGEYEQAEKMWKQIETGDILDYEFPDRSATFHEYQKNTLLFFLDALRNGGISSEPLFVKIQDYIDEEDRIRESGIEFGLTVTEFTTGRVIPYYLEDIPEGELPLYLMASASLYPAIEKTYIDGTPYVDGGYLNNIPVDLALEKGADELIIVDIQGPGLVRAWPEVNEKKMISIKTSWPLGDLLYFQEKRTETNISLGYLETLKAFGCYEGRWYTIHSESVEKEKKTFYRFMYELFQKKHLPELHALFKEEATQLRWMKMLRKEWGERINGHVLPLALAELLAGMLWVAPVRVYTMEELKTAIAEQMSLFKEQDFTKAATQLIPEDFPMAGTEWLHYYKEHLPLFSDKKVWLYFFRLLLQSPSDCFTPINQLLIQLRPYPFVLSLYAFYLIHSL